MSLHKVTATKLSWCCFCACVCSCLVLVYLFLVSPHTQIDQFSHASCFDFTSCFGSSPQWSYACFHLRLTVFSCVFVCNCVPSCLTVWLFFNAEMGSAEFPLLEWLISVSSIKPYYVRPVWSVCVCVWLVKGIINIKLQFKIMATRQLIHR